VELKLARQGGREEQIGKAGKKGRRRSEKKRLRCEGQTEREVGKEI
jgi:hypothetical protein